ncbi:S1-like domain-containing RNA-binding protein [Cytophagaceae bacterium ABcell3]|nr:S1-like domain-containing RNA-binding protein [Cytophagaceae bacterium ABcell3]
MCKKMARNGIYFHDKLLFLNKHEKMPESGKYHKLKVKRSSPHGLYLTDGTTEVLLPNKYTEPSMKEGDEVEVFVYTDSEDRPVATTLKPAGQVGDWVCLEVKDTSKFGAFMDWGLEKDLLVPKSEQHRLMQVGERHVVKIASDRRTGRVIGVAKLGAFLQKGHEGLSEGQKVNLLVYEKTDLGYMAIIDQQYRGILYKNEVFRDIEVGSTMEGYVKKLRSDGKIDLTLSAPDKKEVISDATAILEQKLKENNGVLHLTDKSSPEDIYIQLGMSKRNFKMAVGGLLKRGLIKLEASKIVLT